MIEAYCVKCKAKVAMADPKDGVAKNGRPMVKGRCPVCGTAVCRMGRVAQAKG